MIIFWNGATSGGRVIDGTWTFQLLASYYLFILIVGVFAMSHIEEEVALIDIKEGGISPYLLKPFSYFWMKLFAEMPHRFIQGGFGIVAIFIVTIFFRDIVVFTHSWLIFSLSVACLMLAYVLSFTLKMTVGILAFWLTEIRGMFEVMEVVILILGGILMPLTLYPKLLEQISYVLPFGYIIYFPVIAFQGQLSAISLLQVLAGQLMWIVVFGFLYKWLWRAGIRKYSAIGQ